MANYKSRNGHSNIFSFTCSFRTSPLACQAVEPLFSPLEIGWAFVIASVNRIEAQVLPDMLLWGCLLLGSIHHPMRKSKSVHMEKPAWKGTGAHGQQSALTSRHRSEPLFKPECLPPRPQTITLSKWLTQRIYKIVNHCFRTLHFGKICCSDIVTIAFIRGLDQPPTGSDSYLSIPPQSSHHGPVAPHQ